MAKKYYWLKLNENFFERDEIKVIETMPNGKDYILFYMKLLLKSIKTEGRLMFRGVIPYTPDMLASITNTSVDTVKVATDMFVKLGLMHQLDDGALFMEETQNMIGSETDAAKRMREYRSNSTKNVAERNEVTPMLQDVRKSYTEIEIDKEIDINKDKEKKKKSKESDKEIRLEQFEKLWKLYPNKKGKTTARDKAIKLLKKYDIEELSRAIKRYSEEVKDKDRQYIKQGSTFFTSGYEDYLDCNYEETKTALKSKLSDDAEYFDPNKLFGGVL